MIELLKKYIEEYEIEKAIIVGRNIINQNPNDRETINIYLNFLFDLANALPVIDERRSFLEQGRVVVSFVEENAQLDSEFLDWLMTFSQKEVDIENKINEDEDRKFNNIVSDIEISNGKLLVRVYELCDLLNEVDSQKEFDNLMREFIETDRKIDKDYLTLTDQQQYDELSKKCSETISRKMKELEHIENLEYNEKAAQSFFAAFKEFSDNEAEYKSNVDNLIGMLNKKFFGFDSDRLFPETVIYYQYIYSRIFDKLSDDGKKKITYASIKANR